MYKKHKKCQNKNCRNLLLGSPAIINKMQVCRDCYLKIKFERKIDRMTQKCIVNHKNNKSSTTPLKQAKKRYFTKQWMVITKDGEIVEKFRLKNTANVALSRLREVYLERLEVRRVE